MFWKTNGSFSTHLTPDGDFSDSFGRVSKIDIFCKISHNHRDTRDRNRDIYLSAHNTLRVKQDPPLCELVTTAALFHL